MGSIGPVPLSDSLEEKPTSNPVQLCIQYPGPHRQSREICVPGQKHAPLLITWVREAKPGGLAQDIAFGVGAGQVTIGCGGRGEGIGDREHEAEEPGDAER